MLDLKMLLFSTSDFICIGIVALPLTMAIVSGGLDISFGRPLASAPLHWRTVSKWCADAAGDTPEPYCSAHCAG
ncbi:hypothetical protein ACNKHX_09685 [Shigella flexneri]